MTHALNLTDDCHLFQGKVFTKITILNDNIIEFEDNNGNYYHMGQKNSAQNIHLLKIKGNLNALLHEKIYGVGKCIEVKNKELITTYLFDGINFEIDIIWAGIIDKKYTNEAVIQKISKNIQQILHIEEFEDDINNKYWRKK